MNTKSRGVPLFKKRTSIKSMFNNGINGTNSINNETSLIHQLVINKSVIEITEYFKSYADGNFDSVSKTLNPAVYTNISVALNKLIADKKYIDYEFIRYNLAVSFKALMQSVYQYMDLQKVLRELVIAEEEASILDDLVKLEEYINNLKYRTPITIIPDVDANVPLLTIKEPYNTYIKIYGYPPNGIFDPDKLGQISRAQNANHLDPQC